MQRVEAYPCRECGVPVELSGRIRYDASKRGYAFCSAEHRAAVHSRISSERMRQTNLRDRAILSSRMRERNPMRLDDARRRMTAKLRVRGLGAIQRGGNGKPLPEPQRLLAEALGWPTEVPVRTLQRRGSGYPGAYKVDIANVELRLGVEVDGMSHQARARKALDRKKDELLESLGWVIIRFRNEDVLDSVSACVEAVNVWVEHRQETAVAR